MPEHTPWGGRQTYRMTALVLSTYGTSCHLCGTDGADSPDHLVPRSKGGSNALANLRPAHLGCNRARGDMDLAEWRGRHPLPARPALPPSRKW